MRRTVLAVTAMLAIAASGSAALAWVSFQYHSSDEVVHARPNWPKGLVEAANTQGRVLWSTTSGFGQNTDAFLYRGGAPAFNRFLKRYAKIKDAKLVLIVHAAAPYQSPDWANRLRGPYDWRFSVSERWVTSKTDTPAPKPRFVAEVWPTERLRLRDIVVPLNVDLKSGGEIEKFIKAHKTKQAVPGNEPREDAGEDAQAEEMFDTFHVAISSTWAWNRTLTIRGDGTYTFECQTLEKVPGKKHLQVSKTPYVARHRLSPGDLRELAQLLKATDWLTLAIPKGPPPCDAVEYAMTLTRSGRQSQCAYHESGKQKLYTNLVRFLRRINRQEDMYYAITHRDVPYPPGDDLGGELDGVMGVRSTIRPYAPALDYHRLVPPYAKILNNPPGLEQHAADGAKLMGYLKLESQRPSLEALARGKAPGAADYEVPAELRRAAIDALGMMGAGPSLDALKEAAEAEDFLLSGSVAEALLTARSDKVIPILANLAEHSWGAAWALIRLGREAEPTICDLIMQPANGHLDNRATYNLIRSYHDHWKKLSSPPSAAVLTAMHYKVRSRATGASMTFRYGCKVLELADDPFVLRNAFEGTEAFLSMMADDRQSELRTLLLPLHFRLNPPPDGFLADARRGILRTREVHAGKYDAWAHMSDEKGKTHYVLLVSRTGVVWTIVLVRKTPVEQVKANLDHFLRSHPQAKTVTAGQAQIESDLHARNDAAVARVAQRIMAAVEDNDLATLKRLSAGSVESWLSPEEAVAVPLGMPMGWYAPHQEQRVKALHDIYADGNPKLMRDVRAVHVGSKWAGVHMTGPNGKLAGPGLIVILQRTSQGWRLADVAQAKGELPEDLARSAARLAKLRARLAHEWQVREKEAAIARQAAEAEGTDERKSEAGR